MKKLTNKIALCIIITLIFTLMPSWPGMATGINPFPIIAELDRPWKSLRDWGLFSKPKTFPPMSTTATNINPYIGRRDRSVPHYFESRKNEIYNMGPALIELDPQTLKILDPSNFWPLNNKNNKQYFTRNKKEYDNDIWELNVTGTAEKPIISVDNHKSRSLYGKSTYLFNLETKEFIQQQLAFTSWINRSAQKNDSLYVFSGKKIHGLKGDRIKLPERVKDIDLVSNSSFDYDFLLAITKNRGTLNVWEVPLDDTGNFIGTYDLVTTINNLGTEDNFGAEHNLSGEDNLRTKDYFGADSLSHYTNISYGQIFWEKELKEVLYVSIDGFGSDTYDEVAIVDFCTGDILHGVSSEESEIPLIEPFFMPNGQVADSIFWINPQDLKFFEGRLFIINSICCRPCETTIKKYVSIDGGETFIDADDKPGPIVPVGLPLYFKLIVTNTGFFRMVPISIEDSDYPVDTCVIPDVLNRGESFECVIGPFDAQSGQQTNTSTVEAKPFLERCFITLSDEDDANYYGTGPDNPISIQKSTNNLNADAAPGPSIPVGESVNWTYLVTNRGSLTLTDITLTDSVKGAITCPKNILEAGEFMICTTEGIAQPGQYANTSTVKATDPNGNIVYAGDPSHYFGSSSGLTLEKTTQAYDADYPSGLSIPVGDPVNWSYIITNTGSVTLTDITITDDQGVEISCPGTQLAPEEFMICTAEGIAEQGQYANIAKVTAKDPDGNELTDEDPSHYFGSSSGLVVKPFCRCCAEQPPGPSIPVGEPLEFTYIVSNIGDVILTDISFTHGEEVPYVSAYKSNGDLSDISTRVMDDLDHALSCPKTELAPGESMICTADEVVEPGQHYHIDNVTAKDPDGNTLSTEGYCYHFGVSSGIDLQKITNGSNADTPPGPSIPVGYPIIWKYVVTNTGQVTLSEVSVSDSKGLEVSCPKTQLAPEEFMICTAEGTAKPGPYANVGRVTAKDTSGNDLIDEDPSHYFGSTTGIDINKITNCCTADTPPGPSIPVGDTITWRYIVTNTGNVTLTDITVVDNIGIKGVEVSCPKTQLAPEEFMICTAEGTAAPGPYANIGIVTAEEPNGAVVFDEDPSHYFGSTPGIDIEKITNGCNADTPPGPHIHVGDPITWYYIISNTGNVTLSQVAVSDSKGVEVSCPETQLAPEEFMICTVKGIAKAGPYANIGRVTAKDSNGNDFFDEDPSHYFGTLPQIDIKKETNGYAADNPPGPHIHVGDSIEWQYIVTNSGNVTLTNISVVDNKGVEVSCPKTELTAGAFMICTAQGTALAGPYANFGTVTARDPNGAGVFDIDPSHYFGTLPQIDIQKETNGNDADNPPGPCIPVGDSIEWRYIVSNAGNVTLSNISVKDDKGVEVSCPKTELAAGAFMICTAQGTALAGPHANIGTVYAEDPEGAVFFDVDSSHYSGFLPQIDIQKETNGNNADIPPGPTIPVGDPIEWRYIVTNAGNVTLSNISVMDNQGVEVSCPKTELAAKEFMVCTAKGTSIAGPYANIGTVTAPDPTGGVVFDTDPSHYYGASASITIQKETNGINADNPPGPSIPIGDPVEWTYIVTNTGNVTLTDVYVTDNKQVTVSCDKTELSSGEFMICTANGTALPGVYSNMGTVTAKSPNGDDVIDNDPSHYFGYTVGIEIEKATNGHDADEGHGPYIPVDNPIEWTYVVTNLGNGTLTDVTVTDNKGVTVSCPKTSLSANEIMTCTASGTAEAGQYMNTATVTARAPDNTDLLDYDPSHYFGVSSGINIEKATNGQDADVEPGPTICIGDPVNWSYVVTNSGNVTLTNIGVTDNKSVSVSCPETELAAGESMTCTASGSALPAQYENIGSVTAIDPDNNSLIDYDPSHYFGSSCSGITIEKQTNGNDADNPPGPYITDGYPVNWTYIVTNIGNVELDHIRVRDDGKKVKVTCPKEELAAGESMTCTASGTAKSGQYTNVGDVLAKDHDGNDFIDSDPSHYFGKEPCLQFTKSINGPYKTSNNLFLTDKIIPVSYDAETYGEGVFYFLVSITVSNCGEAALTGVEVIDTFSNEAYPFETSDPTNVTITPAHNPGVWAKETLTWSVGTLQGGTDRSLEIKVGTEQNNVGKLPPLGYGQYIFYNGFAAGQAHKPKATADGGLIVRVDSVKIKNGGRNYCVDCDGEWYLDTNNCTTITTTLPITQTNTTH